MPSVSVVMPVFNGARLIHETLQAVLGQSLPPTEIIVVDDGSTDDTAERIAAIPSVRYVRVPNGGAGRARNAGVAMAAGEWIAFCDHDDLWRPSYLQTLAERLSATSQYGFSNWVDVLDDQWTGQEKFSGLPAGFLSDLGLPLYRKLIDFNPVWPSATFVRKAFFDGIGGFNPRFSRFATEDFEFTLRCSEHLGVVVLREPLVGIRKHEGNYSKGRVRQLLSDAAILEWSSAGHEAGRTFAREMLRNAAQRRSRALDEAFLRGNMQQVREIVALIPSKHRTAKTRAKAALAQSRIVPGTVLRGLIGRGPEQHQVGTYSDAAATPE